MLVGCVGDRQSPLNGSFPLSLSFEEGFEVVDCPKGTSYCGKLSSRQATHLRRNRNSETLLASTFNLTPSQSRKWRWPMMRWESPQQA